MRRAFRSGKLCLNCGASLYTPHGRPADYCPTTRCQWARQRNNATNYRRRHGARDRQQLFLEAVNRGPTRRAR